MWDPDLQTFDHNVCPSCCSSISHYEAYSHADQRSAEYRTEKGIIGNWCHQMEQICKKEMIAYQKYVNRSDIAGGSTLGAIAGSLMPVQTVDIGVPILAMHSARELMGADDMAALSRFVGSYFSI